MQELMNLAVLRAGPVDVGVCMECARIRRATRAAKTPEAVHRAINLMAQHKTLAHPDDPLRVSTDMPRGGPRLV